MNTKNVLLIGIAVFAISLLLTSPVLASADEILDIYGNANEDDTIDMRDLTYVKLIFFGKKPETELADAKYDGKINPLDFVQIKLIIVGKEKQLTIVDSADRTVTVKKPVETIVPSGYSWYALQTMRSLKVDADKIIGVGGKHINDETIFFPEFCDLPAVGEKNSLDYEMILSLHPDLVINIAYKAEERAEKLPGITLVGLDLYRPSSYVEETRKLGYILDREEEAEEFIEFYKGVLNPIKEKVEGIPEGDRPKVYFEAWKTYKAAGRKSGYHEKVTMAGGNNIFSDRDVSSFDVDPEEVIVRDPEIIVKLATGSLVGGGYNTGTDVTKLMGLKNEILNRPELAEVTAVKNERGYTLYSDVIGGTRHFIGIAYMAKYFYPELFEDLDPHALHQEYVTEFQGLDYDIDEHGVFVYPEP